MGASGLRRPGIPSRICEAHILHACEPRGNESNVRHQSFINPNLNFLYLVFFCLVRLLPPPSCLVMTSFRYWFLAALAASAVSAEQVQKSGLKLPDSAAIYKEAVKDIFNASYTAYKCVSLSVFRPAFTVPRPGRMHGGMTICCPFPNRTTMNGTDGVLPLLMLWVLW